MAFTYQDKRSHFTIKFSVFLLFFAYTYIQLCNGQNIASYEAYWLLGISIINLLGTRAGYSFEVLSTNRHAFSYWYKSGCVTLTQCIITTHFASSSSNIWLAFQAKNKIRSSLASTVLTLVWHRSHTACTANHYLRDSGERNWVLRRTKVSLGRTVMQALELQLLRLAQRHISGWS